MTSLLNFLRRIKFFIKNDNAHQKKYRLFKRQLMAIKCAAAPEVIITEYPMLDDATAITPIEPHYTYHPAWAARVLVQTKPAKHIDISSTIYFSTIVSAFIPVEFYDYRPAEIHLTNYMSGKTDLTALHFTSNSIQSLSCMHTVEHIGLGRYGEPIAIDGDMKAMKELERVLAVNGTLLFVVPVGKPRIEFNAHRIYAYNTIIKAFSGLVLKEFSLIPDDFENTGYITNPPIELIDQQNWGCGCFWFTKI